MSKYQPSWISFRILFNVIHQKRCSQPQLHSAGSVFSVFRYSFCLYFVYYIDANLLTVPYERCVSCAIEDGRFNGLLFHDLMFYALAKLVPLEFVEKGHCVAIDRNDGFA